MSNENESVKLKQPWRWQVGAMMIISLVLLSLIGGFGYEYQALMRSQKTIFILEEAVRSLQVLVQEIQKAQQLQQAQKESVVEQPDHVAAELYQRVSALDRQIDTLPLVQPMSKPAMNESSKINFWQRLLQKMIVVRHMDRDALPLVLPQEKQFLYQNMHAEMQTMLWAVLHANQDIYAESIKRLSLWVQRYFDTQAEATVTFMQALQTLQTMNVKAE